MAVEILTRETLSSKAVELVCLVTGETSTSAARTAALAGTNTTENGLSRRAIDVTVEELDDQDTAGNQIYEVTVPYGTGGGSNPTQDLEVGNTRILFNTIGGSTHITQSLETKHSYGDAEDHEEAIGVDADGNVTGTNILTGAFDFSIIKIVNSSALTAAYVGNIRSLNTPNPHTNNAAFTHTDTDGRVVQGDEGEILFIGFTNTPRGDGTDELRFDFKGSDNLADALPATGWTVSKEGWEHLWVRYEKDLDAVADRLVTKPFSAFVEKVYEAGDFSLLSL